MANLYLNDVPQSVVDKLKERSEHTHRPLEEEAKVILIQALASARLSNDISSEELIKRARHVRQGHPQAWLTEDFLRRAKEYGRR